MNLGSSRGMYQSESRYVTAAEIAYRLTSRALPKYSHAKSTTHHYELPQLAACVLMMFYLDLSYRDMEKWLLATDKVCQVLGLPRVPDHTTLQRTHQKLRHLGFERMKIDILEEEHWKNQKLLLNNREDLPKTDNSLWLSRLMVIWLAGMVSFLPVQILNLPQNFDLADI